MDRLKIALLAGGWSGEREVSLKSAEAVYGALDRGKYDVTVFDPRDDLMALMEAKEEVGLAFILLHGKFGEDGRMQGLLDVLGIPFIGSGVLSSAMAFNKRVAKEAYRNAGLIVGKDIVLRQDEKVPVEDVIKVVGLPAVVKPVAEGSSIGISVCAGKKELIAGIEVALTHDREVMIEEYIDGKEVTCCVLGDRDIETFPLVEIVPGEEYPFFDYKAKYTAGATREICPARLSQPFSEEAKLCAIKAHKALGCSVWSRSDMIIRGADIYLLETNTIPGMTENSLFPLAARTAGLSLSDLVDKLIMLAIENAERAPSPSRLRRGASQIQISP